MTQEKKKKKLISQQIKKFINLFRFVFDTGLIFQSSRKKEKKDKKIEWVKITEKSKKRRKYIVYINSKIKRFFLRKQALAREK